MEFDASVTLRALDGSGTDRHALRELAERDSRPVPSGLLIGAEVSGRLLAAISVDSGELVAEPSSSTTGLHSLLELRRAQVRRQLVRGRKPRKRLLARRRPARAALAGSPPGAGGRLLELR